MRYLLLIGLFMGCNGQSPVVITYDTITIYDTIHIYGSGNQIIFDSCNCDKTDSLLKDFMDKFSKP